jgi:hypothetical protein
MIKKIFISLIALISVITLTASAAPAPVAAPAQTITLEMLPIQVIDFANVEKINWENINTWTGSKLTKRGGVNWGPSGKETWYSQKVLPGGGLKIPGRHVAEDGTIRDIDGFIVVAADLSYRPRYTIVGTSLGLGKVYDTGCDYGTIDIYVNW